MTFERRLLRAISLLALLAGLASLPLNAQTVSPTPSPDSTATSAPTPASAHDAYTFRLTNSPKPSHSAASALLSILPERCGDWSFCGCSLPRRGWAAIERWMQWISSRHWVQGLVFFAAFFIVTTLASSAARCRAHHFERAYGISVSHGVVGWAIRRRRWDWRSFRRADSVALPLDRAPLAAQVLARSAGR